MIYLDNAATTFPKPRSVCEEVGRAISEYGGNPGRGAHALSLAAAEKIYSCREALAEFFGLDAPERVVFTLNTTYALNLAIKGLLGPGEHALISELEHNAVCRPLAALAAERQITFDTFPVLGLDEKSLLAGIESRILPKTRAIICTHASNICSLTLPLRAIGRLCRRRGLLFIVDAAQSAGHLPIHMREMQIDALAVPGHKSLYGIQGCGALLLSERVLPRTLIEGGSGFASLSPQMPDEPPERFEAGTLPTPAIAALLCGVKSLQGQLEQIHERERLLFVSARDRLSDLRGIRLYAPEHEGAVLLFSFSGIPSSSLAQALSERGICLRAGLHCAPLAHKALGTPEVGALRISFGRYNTLGDIDTLCRALSELV